MSMRSVLSGQYLRPCAYGHKCLDGIELSVEMFLEELSAQIARNAVPSTGAHYVNALLFGRFVVLNLHVLHVLGLSRDVQVAGGRLHTCPESDGLRNCHVMGTALT